MSVRRVYRRAQASHGFTLIELLVVVAIIALLLSILIPAVNRAREQARMVVCGQNVRQLAMAFHMYAVDNKGEMPGGRRDRWADWWGRYNKFDLDTNKGDLLPWPTHRRGTLYKYAKQVNEYLYACPTQKAPLGGQDLLAYTQNVLLSGAKVEWLAGAHYPDPACTVSSGGKVVWDTKDHRPGSKQLVLRSFEGVPMLVEQFLTKSSSGAEDSDHPGGYDSGWFGSRSITNRHLKNASGQPGAGNIAFHDGHVKSYRLPGGDGNTTTYFSGLSHCIRTKGGYWVSGYYAPDAATYGILAKVPTGAGGVLHK